MKPNRHLLVLAREVRGLTQTELAEKSGIDQGVISRFETGWRLIQLEALAKLAEALHFPEAFFCQDYEPPAPMPWAHICRGRSKYGG
jgi:transcriptional regulator with XRE-family HTH domain